MPNCGWWIKNITVSGMIVKCYIGIAGNSWSVVLKDSKGNVEAQTSGSSYGDQAMTAKTTGPHTLELTCNWNTSNPCEVCPVDVTGVVPPPPPPDPCKDLYDANGCPAGQGYMYDKSKNYCWAPGKGGFTPGVDKLPCTSPPPPPPPPSTSAGCTEGTTRTVKCPKNGKDVLQKCVGGAWVTQPGKENKCEGTDPTKAIIIAVVLALILIFLGSKA